MEKKVNRSEVIRKLFDSLSAREKKIVRTELFGGSKKWTPLKRIKYRTCFLGYPNEDLSDETCLKIIARLRPSAREKLKPYKIIRHLVDHFAILDRDQFEIYGKNCGTHIVVLLISSCVVHLLFFMLQMIQ